MIQSRADLLEEVETMRDRVAELERDAAARIAAAAAERDEAVNQVADVLVVLARHGHDIGRGNPAVLVDLVCRSERAAALRIA